MDKKIVIFGTTSYSYMLSQYIHENRLGSVVAFMVNKDYMEDKTSFFEYPLFPFEQIEGFCDMQSTEILIGLGYHSMNTSRERIFKEVREKGYKIAQLIHPSSIIETTDIGEGNIILSGVYIGKNSKIGDANIFWNNCNISHDARIGNFNYFSPSFTSGGFVTIDNNCFFGINSAVRSSVKISNKTLVGAGCYLNSNTNPEDVYVPARATRLKHKSTEMNF